MDVKKVERPTLSQIKCDPTDVFQRRPIPYLAGIMNERNLSLSPVSI